MPVAEDHPTVDDALLRVEDLKVEFATRGGRVHAVSGVDFSLRRGETLGIVGESGCGKSSLVRALLQLPPPTGGRVCYGGTDLVRAGRRQLRDLRREIQIVFQDPISSLNPRRSVRSSIAEPARVWMSSAEAFERADEMLELVGLDPEAVGDRRPNEFSGGQCQRISIARALVLAPRLLICDEPVSALDVSVQAQVLNLLRELKAKLDLTMIFVGHDMGVVKNIADRVAVMYLGTICEVGPAEVIFSSPAHPYTRALLSSVPVADPDVDQVLEVIAGEMPSPLAPPTGCRFRTRCPIAHDRCAAEEPRLRAAADSVVACHTPLR